MRRTAVRLVLAGVLLAGSALCTPPAGGHGPTTPRHRATAPAPTTWQLISKGELDSGTSAMQVARTSDGLYVPITIKDPSTAARVSHEALITNAGKYLGDRPIDPSGGCTTDHALLGFGLSSPVLFAVAGGLPLTGCTSDEMVEFSTIGPSLPFGNQVNWVQWGNHAYNAGGQNLALLATSPTSYLTAFTAPEGLVIGHSGAGYGPTNPTPVLDACCLVDLPNLALDPKTGHAWVSWYAYQGSEWTVRVRMLDAATGAAIGPVIDMVPPKSQSKKFHKSGATQRTALASLKTGGTFAAFLGRGTTDTNYPTVWIAGLPGTQGKIPVGVHPKRVFGAYDDPDLFSNVTLASSGAAAGKPKLWVVATVWLSGERRYAYVARRWAAESWGVPTLLRFPKGVPNGSTDIPFAIMADAERTDGDVDVLTQPGSQATGLYHRIVRPAGDVAKLHHGQGATYQIRLSKDVYVAPGTKAVFRFKTDGKPGKAKVQLHTNGRAVVHLPGKVKPLDLAVTTGDFQNVYDFG